MHQNNVHKVPQIHNYHDGSANTGGGERENPTGDRYMIFFLLMENLNHIFIFYNIN